MHAATSRRRTQRRALALAIAVGSVAAHAAVVAMVDVRSPNLGARRVPRDAAEADYDCMANARLALAARFGYCGSPTAPGGLRACSEDAIADYRVKVALCRDPLEPEDVKVALVDVDDLHVEPAPLLPDVAPMDDAKAAELVNEEVAQKLEEAAKPIENPTPTGQVVEITPPKVEIAPDQAKYLSEYDSKVDKQTVARGSTEDMVAKPGPRELETGTHPTEKLPDQLTGKSGPDFEAQKAAGTEGQGKNLMAMRGPGADLENRAAIDPGERSGAEVAAIDGIGPRRGDGAEPSERRETSGGGGEGGDGPKKTPNLRPSEDVLERVAGGGSVDDVTDADDDEVTGLNSRRWKYANFFNRMKRQVARNWHPDEVYLRRDPTGNIYGTKDRITVLRISLKPNGQLAKVYVSQQSGVDFLDDEAIRAFRESQPFPNPPAGLVDAGSNLITFSFGFHFEIGGERSHWQIFRYQ
jgi:TonB family protein